jgi:hypothetical protein
METPDVPSHEEVKFSDESGKNYAHIFLRFWGTNSAVQGTNYLVHRGPSVLKNTGTVMKVYKLLRYVLTLGYS